MFSFTSNLVSLLPVDVGRLQGSREERRIVGANEGVSAVHVAELVMADSLSDDGLKLQVGKVLANAAVATSAERQVGRGRALADQAVSVVDLLLILDGSAVADNGRGVGGVDLPAVRVPGIGVGEVGRVGAADTGSGEEGVAGRDDELSAGDSHGLLDGAHDRVNGSVQAESLLDDSLVEG